MTNLARAGRLDVLKGLLASLKRTKAFMEENHDNPEVALFSTYIYLGETMRTYELNELRIEALEAFIAEAEK